MWNKNKKNNLKKSKMKSTSNTTRIVNSVPQKVILTLVFALVSSTFYAQAILINLMDK
jgi:hypothetical protein